MLFSIIIPTCNRNELLALCLEKLNPEVQNVGVDYEVIVTDDNKSNTAQAMIAERFPWVTWVAGPQKGPASNRNNGARKAKGQWLIFTDDDCLPTENWVNAYADAFTDDLDVVYEGMTNADREQQRFDEEAPINLTGNKLWSCNFAISKNLFEKLNGFDETFPFAAMEDVDFYLRVSKNGKLQFLSKALIIHPWRLAKKFGSYKKHILSHKHFRKVYSKESLGFKFRLSRLKIFLRFIFTGFVELAGFRFRGFEFYLEKVYIYLVLIFI